MFDLAMIVVLAFLLSMYGFPGFVSVLFAIAVVMMASYVHALAYLAWLRR
jgi:hypothetical protein